MSPVFALVVHICQYQPPEFHPTPSLPVPLPVLPAPSPPIRAWKLYQQPDQDLTAVWVQDASLDLCGWALLLCVHLWLHLQLHATERTPVTSFYYSMNTLGEIGQPQESMLTARAPSDASGLGQALSSVAGLRYHTLLYAGFPAAYPRRIPVTSPQYSATPRGRLCSHGRRCWQPGPHSCQWNFSWLQSFSPALASTTTSVFASGPCHYTGTCSWPPQLSACILPSLATTAPCPDL